MRTKREKIISYALILLTVVYIVFMTVYDYRNMNAYLETLEGKERAGSALGFLLMYIFGYIILWSGGLGATAILSLIALRRLSKCKERGRRNFLITLLVCQIVGFVLTAWGTVYFFSSVYSDWLMRLVGAVTALSYLGAILHTAIYFKKIVNER